MPGDLMASCGDLTRKLSDATVGFFSARSRMLKMFAGRGIVKTFQFFARSRHQQRLSFAPVFHVTTLRPSFFVPDFTISTDFSVSSLVIGMVG